jgi:hypothetical protein
MPAAISQPTQAIFRVILIQKGLWKTHFVVNLKEAQTV